MRQEPLDDQLVVFDDFLVNRPAHWPCTICGCGPMVRAGTWVGAETGSPARACAFVLCHACDTAGQAAYAQLDRKLRARYGLRPLPEHERTLVGRQSDPMVRF